jgi:hypothetical protein
MNPLPNWERAVIEDSKLVERRYGECDDHLAV